MGVSAVLAGWPGAGRAGDGDEDDARAHNQVRLVASVTTFTGSELVGVGSRGRYRLGGGSVELGVDRFIGPLGIGMHAEGFATEHADLNYARLEGALGVRVASWRGPAPGGIAAFAGLGGDVGRYWYAEDGRFYGLGRVKARWWLSRDVPMQLAYAGVPAAVSSAGVSLHEHRFELATGWKLLAFGTRIGLTFARGGEPERALPQQEIGAFVGLGLLQ